MNHPRFRGPFRTLLRLTLLLGLLGTLVTIPEGTQAGTATRFEARGSLGYRGILEFQAAPLLTMRPTPFSLILIDLAGTRTTAPLVDCDLIMPAMPMPENRPQVVTKEDTYSGEAVFTMAGAWQAIVTFKTADGRPEKLVFDFGTVLLK